MDPTRLHFDVVAAATTVASGTGAVVTAALPSSFGLPVPELLAAFAGAALILSFLPPQADAERLLHARLRTLGMILFCTFGAVWGGPLAAVKLGVEGKYQLAVTFVVAAVLQVAIPMALERRGEVVEFLKGFLPGRKT